jgi:small subunit ribosomal protein S1
MRIEKPSEVLHEGQTVDIKILSIDREKKKISLGMKQLSQNPWSTAEDKYAVGSIVSGKIGRIMDFGAFVVLESGVEGLLHISELDHRRVRRVTDVVAVDQTVDVKVLEVDTKRRRIALSLKALKAAPEEEPAVTEAEERESAESIAATKKRRASLKGGNSQSKGSGSGAGSGGLFGNPGSFS